MKSAPPDVEVQRIAMRKLHIGGQVRKSGWEVLDATPGLCVEHVGNASDLTRPAG